MNLLRYHALDMPIYPVDHPVAWSRVEIATTAASKPEFIRRMSIYDTRLTRLDKLLTLFHEMVGEVCQRTGAILPSQSIGLLPLPPGGELPCQRVLTCYHHGDVPDGYHLVARVESVVPADVAADSSALDDKCVEYTKSGLQKQGPYIYDVSPNQFVYGIASQSGTSGWHYVDREPRLSWL